jgi:hypothetical protein
MKISKLLLSGLTAALMLTATTGSAIQISYADYGVGYWSPASIFNGDPVIDQGVQRSIDVWNGDAAAGAFGGATFTKGAGSLLPTTLPDVIAYVNRDESSPYQLDNSLGLYSYMTAKYGNDKQVVFYIADIKDIITVENKFGGSGPGLSHLSWLTAAPASVPDGGLTVMLLGAALTGIGLVRRFVRF